MTRTKPERDLQRKIMLRAKNLGLFMIGVYNENSFYEMITKGFPDNIVFSGGKAYFIEFKRPPGSRKKKEISESEDLVEYARLNTDKLSGSQKEVRATLKNCGFDYFVVNSLEVGIKVLDYIKARV